MFVFKRGRAIALTPFVVLVLLQSSISFAKTLVFQQQGQDAAVASSSSADGNASQGKTYTTASVSSSASSGNSELFFMLEQLQQEVRMLRGMLEEQANQIHHLQQSGKNRYKDLDARVLDLSRQIGTSSKSSQAIVNVVPVQPVATSPAGAAQAVNLPPTAEPASPEQKQAYQAAYAHIKDKNFAAAVDALHLFIEKYPDGELAGNAYYWLGEVYLVLPQLEQARQSFSIVIKSFPNHRKVADALFKLGVTYDRMQDPAKSEQYLNLVQASFPDSTAAKLAKSYKINR